MEAHISAEIWICKMYFLSCGGSVKRFSQKVHNEIKFVD